MPKAARCDFNSASGRNDDGDGDRDLYCGWKDAVQQMVSFSRPDNSVWVRRNGRTALEGIKGDLSEGNRGT